MTKNTNRQHLSREEYLERERKYKKAQRDRDQLSRAVENKYNKKSEVQKILININEEVIDSLSGFSDYYEMSSRSRTVLINNFLKTRLKQVDEITKFSEMACTNRGETYRHQARAIAMEIAILGGTIDEYKSAIHQFNEEIRRVGESRNDRTVMPGDIDIFDLEAFKSLSED